MYNEGESVVSDYLAGNLRSVAVFERPLRPVSPFLADKAKQIFFLIRPVLPKLFFNTRIYCVQRGLPSLRRMTLRCSPTIHTISPSSKTVEGGGFLIDVLPRSIPMTRHCALSRIPDSRMDKPMRRDPSAMVNCSIFISSASSSRRFRSAY